MCLYIIFFFFSLSESSRLKYKSFLSECCPQQWQQYSSSLSADAMYFLLQNLQRGRTELYINGGRNIKRLEASCDLVLVGFFRGFFFSFFGGILKIGIKYHLQRRLHTWDARCHLFWPIARVFLSLFFDLLVFVQHIYHLGQLICNPYFFFFLFFLKKTKQFRNFLKLYYAAKSDKIGKGHRKLLIFFMYPTYVEIVVISGRWCFYTPGG